VSERIKPEIADRSDSSSENGLTRAKRGGVIIGVAFVEKIRSQILP